jgi:hypothetical protein
MSEEINVAEAYDKGRALFMRIEPLVATVWNARCSCPFIVARAVLSSWSQGRPSPAAVKVTPSPIALMATSWYILREACRRLEPAPR